MTSTLVVFTDDCQYMSVEEQTKSAMPRLDVAIRKTVRRST